jgi:hypothetical protein
MQMQNLAFKTQFLGSLYVRMHDHSKYQIQININVHETQACNEYKLNGSTLVWAFSIMFNQHGDI